MLHKTLKKNNFKLENHGKEAGVINLISKRRIIDWKIAQLVEEIGEKGVLVSQIENHTLIKRCLVVIELNLEI